MLIESLVKLKKDILDNFNLKLYEIDDYNLGYNNGKYIIQIYCTSHLSDKFVIQIININISNMLVNSYTNVDNCYEIIKKYFNKEIRKNKLENIIK